MSTYGTGEYLVSQIDGTVAAAQLVGIDPNDKRNAIVVNETGSPISFTESRLPDDMVLLDEDCPLKGLEDENTPTHCRTLRKSFKKYTELPACWDFNETVVGGQPCRNETGHVLPSCIEIGITSTAQIVICGGEMANDPHCGTFLEIHQKDGYTPLVHNETVLSSKQITTPFLSGYSMTTLSTNFMGNSSRVLCKGPYEIWWVQRTPYNFIVQKKKSLDIFYPPCTFDTVSDRYLPFAEVAKNDWKKATYTLPEWQQSIQEESNTHI